MKKCILDDKKICNGCGECNRCDIDPNKICDNCCKCLEMSDRDYDDYSISELVKSMNKDDEWSDILGDNGGTDVEFKLPKYYACRLKRENW